MGTIRTFEAPSLGLNPTETGVEATAQAANRIGRFFNQAGAAATDVGNQFARGVRGDIEAAGNVAVQYVDYQDRSKVSAAATNGLAGLEQKWQQTLKGVPDPNNPGQYLVAPADPNDANVKEKFQNEQVEPFLEKLQGVAIGENGQRYAQAKADEIRQHISNKLTADMATQAGNAVVLNRIKTVNNLGALVSTDPSFSTVDFALKQSRDDMDAHTASPTLTADQLGRLKIHQTEDEMKIVHAAAVSAIGKSANPEATAQAFIAKYPDLIKGDEANTLAKAAVATNKTNLLATKQAQLYQKQLDTLSVERGANDVFTKNVSTDVSGKVIVNQQFFKDALDLVKNNPNAPNAATVGKTLLDWGQAQQRAHNEVIQTDPVTQKALLDRVFDPNNPTSAIDVLRAEADHKLSSHDGTVMRQLIEATQGNGLRGPVYQSAMDAAKERLGVATMPDGHERYASFMSQFWPEYLRQKANGTLPPDALDLKDPNSLISRALKAYEPSPQQRLQAFALKHMPIDLSGFGADAPGTGTPAVKTQADYDKLAPGTIYISPDGSRRMKAVPSSSALPSVSERKTGQTYPTPRGPMTWTGTGWVEPASVPTSR